ncbi:redox-regulated ATPase YchF [Bdellovibrio svalbardensis]|uniref:Ribosome-binding ATPase YchF n=1 Tax=Bdellovibrio svalbardensis TaxID=2972972 RepID=A0ABT6DJ73_9BACT|nr:redox-regulated ATPase YchF [Bdellovibrio svalbardensis]MDG0815911.1 redox-regulated ATPase YchF [Bdellovibrio svalbardensis]
MALQVGIVGLPNVGKSTLFNALTSAKAEAANYPFCTIDPNVGVVTVPDPRMDKITTFIKPQKVIPTTMEFVDIAGIVKGASQGEGLGNQFLSHIRATDAIVHVVRCFDDPNIIHVAGSVDPLRDIEIINTELMLADLDSAEKRMKRTEKMAKSTTDKKIKMEYEVSKKAVEALSKGLPARSVTLDDQEAPFMKEMHLLTAKPVLYAMNVNDADFAAGGNDWTKQVEKRAAEENNQTILICSAMEAEIALLPPEDRADFLAALGAEEPGLNRLIREAYTLLGLQTYFTAGEKEVRAWTIRANTKAPQAAGVIHTDFEKGFIRAETYHCEDLFTYKSEQAVKDAGKYRVEGKEYVVKDGDILFFRFNV